MSDETREWATTALHVAIMERDRARVVSTLTAIAEHVRDEITDRMDRRIDGLSEAIGLVDDRTEKLADSLGAHIIRLSSDLGSVEDHAAQQRKALRDHQDALAGDLERITDGLATRPDSPRVWPAGLATRRRAVGVGWRGRGRMKPGPWTLRAVCPCGWHTKIPEGDWFFIDEALCPDCGSRIPRNTSYPRGEWTEEKARRVGPFWRSRWEFQDRESAPQAEGDRVEELEAEVGRLHKHLDRMGWGREYRVRWAGDVGWNIITGGREQIRELEAEEAGLREYQHRLVGSWEPVDVETLTPSKEVENG